MPGPQVHKELPKYKSFNRYCDILSFLHRIYTFWSLLFTWSSTCCSCPQEWLCPLEDLKKPLVLSPLSPLKSRWPMSSRRQCLCCRITFAAGLLSTVLRLVGHAMRSTATSTWSWKTSPLMERLTTSKKHPHIMWTQTRIYTTTYMLLRKGQVQMRTEIPRPANRDLMHSHPKTMTYSYLHEKGMIFAFSPFVLCAVYYENASLHVVISWFIVGRHIRPTWPHWSMIDI